MLKDARVKHVMIRAGYTDMRRGAAGLTSIIAMQFGMDPYVPDTLYLFCGRSRKTIKGILWEEDGILLLTKKLADGAYQWPRTSDEVKELTPEQFRRLMEGFTLESSIRNAHPKAEPQKTPPAPKKAEQPVKTDAGSTAPGGNRPSVTPSELFSMGYI